MAKDYGVRAGQARKSFLSVVTVYERHVADSGRYGGYRWCSGEREFTIELISERELATMPLSPWTPEYQSHTRERIEKAIADDRERWGLTPL